MCVYKVLGPLKKKIMYLTIITSVTMIEDLKKKKNPFLAPFPNVVFYCIYGKTQQLHAHKLQFR